MARRRILMDTESSLTYSGFGTYSKELLTRLHNSGKFEIAELASYARLNNPANRTVPWKFYCNDVDEGDPRKQVLEDPANAQFQFNKWRFDRVCLDFKPDIVFNIRDYWMMEHTINSPLRPYFHLVLMPCVDSEPQQDRWMDGIITADAVFSYTDWGANVLRKQGGDIINVLGSAPYGIDLDRYKPVVNKIEHKQKLGFGPTTKIIGTVMRNQRRKLFCDMIETFAKYLDYCQANGHADLARDTYLYLHTSYPDIAGSWNIPGILREYGVGHKVLFTYICHRCNNAFVAYMQDAKTICPRCHQPQAGMANVGKGLSVEQLIDIYNCFDVYVQYATREGFGMPQVEAAACGVPVMATDLTAMSDVVRKVNGTPIPVIRHFREPAEDAYGGLPDMDFTVTHLFKLLSMSDSERSAKGIKARAGVAKHYDWDRIANVWSDYFENAELTGKQGKWDSPPNVFFQTQQTPPGLSNSDFVNWCITNVLGDNSVLNSYMALDMIRCLNFGTVAGHNQRPMKYTHEEVVKKLENMRNNRNTWEQARCGMIPLNPEDYIQFANRNSIT